MGKPVPVSVICLNDYPRAVVCSLDEAVVAAHLTRLKQTHFEELQGQGHVKTMEDYDAGMRHWHVQHVPML